MDVPYNKIDIKASDNLLYFDIIDEMTKKKDE